MAERVAELPGVWRRTIAGYVAAGRAAELSGEMLRVREGHLARFAAQHPDPWAVDYWTAAQWWSEPAWSDTTQTSVRNALRAFYVWAIQQDLTETDPTRAPDAEQLPLPWQAPIAGWRTEMRAAGRSPGTVAQRLDQIRRFATVARPSGAWKHPDPLTVTRLDLVEHLAQFRTAATKTSVKSGLSTFYRYLEDAELLPPGKNPAARLPKVRVPPGVPRPAEDHDIVTAMRVAGPRTLLMIRLAAELGLRRAEIASADNRNIQLDGLRVVGKGGRTRVVPLPPDLRSVLQALPRGLLFPAPGGGHLTPAYVGRLIGDLLPPGVTAHKLRHAAATAWHDAGLDIGDISPLLGHSSVRTTANYVFMRSGKARAAIEAAAGRFAVPAPAPGKVVPLGTPRRCATSD